MVAALVAVAASAVVVQRLTTPAIRFLEGYWPPPLRGLRRILTDRARHREEGMEERWLQLKARIDGGTATVDDRAEHSRLESRLRRMPASGYHLPTRVGNTLRAGETRPMSKYGLNTSALWPHLWLLLPDVVRAEIGQARAALNAAAAAGIWALAFTCFTPWAWWAAPAGIGVMLSAYLLWLPARAEVYADLVEAAFDLYRTSLYQQLRWPLPVDPQQERRTGDTLSRYLLRGPDDDNPAFDDPR
ncbi:hypothetical protein AAH979_39815 [Plantactinospora sp. ZYX-F-223]|uniref:hypothetical protein n=1 Tax=Plantactinospora sp. ZYX-F-223 TaxID=3144103 RepID=UPI0031FD7C8F